MERALALLGIIFMVENSNLFEGMGSLSEMHSEPEECRHNRQNFVFFSFIETREIVRGLKTFPNKQNFQQLGFYFSQHLLFNGSLPSFPKALLFELQAHLEKAVQVVRAAVDVCHRQRRRQTFGEQLSRSKNSKVTYYDSFTDGKFNHLLDTWARVITNL